MYASPTGFSLTASGGTAPYHWSWAAANGSSLPPGLNLLNAAVSGTPTATGSFTVIVTVTDSASPAAQQAATYTIVITAPVTLSIAPTSPPGGAVGAVYSGSSPGFPLNASGGVTPYTWSWTAANGSSLPPGLSLSNGSISGTPTLAGSYKVALTVTDSQLPPTQATANFTIVIVNPPPPVIVSSPAPPAGAINVPYSGFTFRATGGLLPLTWSNTGALPPGMAVGTDGTLSGTPTAIGSFPITLAVQDALRQNAVPQAFTVEIDAKLPSFTATGSMQTARASHTATLLSDGKVIVIGGLGNNGKVVLESAEFFDPATGQFTSTVNLMTPRSSGPVSRKKKSGIKALSLDEVKSIAHKFRKLNPYDPSLVSEILKIEDVNHVDFDPQKPFRQLFGYAISAKRYALYSQSENDIHIQKASGHGLGYLFAPKESKRKEEDEETPQWVFEAWEFLLRKTLHLPSRDPNWLDLPAMMRMVVTTPNVFKQRRPEWLGPFNFFLFPMLSETFGGYPAGFDKSNFVFITPYESDRKKWGSLRGVNLMDGQSYQISMRPTLYQDNVVPESFRILLRKYLGKPEVKSLAPDGTPCTATTRGLLQRVRITAKRLVPVGKETDRRWEQGEDPSMIDSDIFVYEKRTKLVIADPGERKRWSDIGLRRLMRETKLSQPPVSNALKGKGVRPQTLSIIRETAARILAE